MELLLKGLGGLLCQAPLLHRCGPAVGQPRLFVLRVAAAVDHQDGQGRALPRDAGGSSGLHTA